MNRLGTALLAAVEALVTVGVGFGIALVPLTLLWGFEYGLQVDWDVFWNAAGSVWLVGHGVDVTFVLGSAVAKATGVSGASAPIPVTLAALGFAMVTAWLAARAGRRFAETEHRVTGVLVGTGVTALLGLGIALSSASAATRPSVWQAVVFPALWFGIPALVAAEVCRRRRGVGPDPVTSAVLDQLERVPSTWRAIAAFGMRAGTTATACVVAVAGVLVGFLLLGSFAEVITLYERSHAGLVGGVALTVGQLAFLPDLVGWATAWLVGPGFAIGTGSNVSPIGTTLGPIPGLPVFGALPAAGHTFGLLWVLVPVLAGFAAGGVMRPRLVHALGSADGALHRALGGIATGIVAGVLTGLVAWASSGSFGPGRLTDVGPHGLVVGAFAALEVGVPAAIALAVGQDLVRMPERSWTRERWHEAGQDTGSVAAAGSLLDALDRAGAGRTTDVHRFVVEEAQQPVRRTSASGPEPASDSAPTRTVPDNGNNGNGNVDAGTDGNDGNVDAGNDGNDGNDGNHGNDDNDGDGDAGSGADAGRASRPADVRDGHAVSAAETDHLAELPGPSRAGGLRDRIRGAADGVRGRADGLAGGLAQRAGGLKQHAEGLRDRASDLRERAGGLRDRVTGADAERPDPAPDDRPDRHRPQKAEVAGAPDEQPAFPWSTAEYVAGRDDADEQPTPPPMPPTTTSGRWDQTDQVPDEELPWWRRPQGDR